MITDLIDGWRAKKEWTKEKLLKKYGDCKFKTDEVDSKANVKKQKKKAYFSLQIYLCKPILNFDLEKFSTNST